MRKLSLKIVMLIMVVNAWGQENPHGETLAITCADCHSTDSWEFITTSKFNHDSTSFNLEGQHKVASCKKCHVSLVFGEAKSNCVDCHTDMHNTTVGTDCAQCHNSNSWLVSNITEIHHLSRFPLLGAHNTADCADCHTSASKLEFEPLGVECIDCHQTDYMATSNPNHVQTGFSTNCIECHRMEAHEWSASGINHDFFPLIKGHKITDCTACHTSGISEPLSTDCYICHQNDFASATNPPHQSSGFSTSCTDCHTIDPGWKPAEFDHDNQYFPIYSGKHRGEWNSCVDCHTEPSNYSEFSCINCHEHNQSKMNEEHREISHYVYSSISCLSCHPSGNSDDD